MSSVKEEDLEIRIRSIEGHQTDLDARVAMLERRADEQQRRTIEMLESFDKLVNSGPDGVRHTVKESVQKGEI